jgi:hypothetical protein
MLVLVGSCLFLGGLVATAQYQPAQVLRAPLHGAAFVEGQPDTEFQKEVLRQLADIHKKLDRILEEPETPGPDKAQAGANVLADGLSKCLGCHNPKDAPKKGDRFVLFTGERGNEFRDDLRRSELKAMEEKVKEGIMPKKSSGLKLTPEERTAIIAEVSARRAELDKAAPKP